MLHGFIRLSVWMNDQKYTPGGVDKEYFVCKSMAFNTNVNCDLPVHLDDFNLVAGVFATNSSSLKWFHYICPRRQEALNRLNFTGNGWLGYSDARKVRRFADLHQNGECP